jgi:Ca2+-binding RTX toxin-like protein
MGGDGNDQLNGGAGDDILYGDEGDDILQGGAGSDTYIFHGGANWGDRNGNDTIILEEGELDIIQFSDPGCTPLQMAVEREGDDLILRDLVNNETTRIKDAFSFDQYGFAEVRFASGEVWSYSDLVAAQGLNIQGAEIDETLEGGYGVDLINGNGGVDTIRGNAGNDQLIGGSGNDIISGGYGNDFIDGGADNDLLEGEVGNDNIEGGSGDDRLDGGDGNDVLSGGEGIDQITGGNGNDVLNGGYGREGLYFNTYDFLRGDAGNDTYVFNIGDGGVTVDQSFSGPTDFDVIRFGEGIAPEDVELIYEGDFGYGLSIQGGESWSGDYILNP